MNLVSRFKKQWTAHKSRKSPDLSSFPQFTRLPIELQLLIVGYLELFLTEGQSCASIIYDPGGQILNLNVLGEQSCMLTGVSRSGASQCPKHEL